MKYQDIVNATIELMKDAVRRTTTKADLQMFQCVPGIITRNSSLETSETLPLPWSQTGIFTIPGLNADGSVEEGMKNGTAKST